MRVLVTGGNGFIGSHVTDALSAAGAQVSVLDTRPELYRKPLPEIRYIQGSFGDAEALQRILDEPTDAVIHVANYGLSLDAPGIPDSDLRNLNDSVKLFEACIRNNVAKVVFMSTGGKIYGPTSALPVSESHATNPLGSYGITKLAIEKHLLSLSHYHGIKATILRPSNPYGVRQSPIAKQGVIPIFAWKILHKQPITIWGAGDAVRDYLRVEDVASVCAMAAFGKQTGVYNLGSGIGLSTINLVGILADLLQTKPIIHREPERKFDLPTIVLDSTRAQEDFGWMPHTDLGSGLAGVIDWLRDLAANPIKLAGTSLR
jgi:UDP-glucose 4-epimerase